jgi:DNA-binding NtrC family response regulator
MSSSETSAKTDVVLLEDDALINMSMAGLIEEMGYAVRSFMHVARCADAVRERLPDIAVLDVNVAGETSYDLADWLDEHQVPVIFLTGYDSPALDARLTRQHPTCRKPCNAAELKKLIAKALAARMR